MLSLPAAVVAVLLLLFPAALAQQQEPTPIQTTPVLPPTPMKVSQPSVGWLDVIRQMNIPHNLWYGFWNLVGPSIAFIINTLCSGALPSTVISFLVGGCNTIFGGVFNLFASCGISMTAGVGMGILGFFSSIISLGFNLVNFIFTTGVAGMAVIGTVLAMINLLAVMVSYALDALLVLLQALMGVLTLFTFMCFTWIPVCANAFIAPLLAVTVMLLKLQQTVMAMLSQPFAMFSLPLIFDSICEIPLSCAPVVPAWLGAACYPVVCCGSTVAYTPVIGTGVAMFCISVAIAILALSVGTVLSILTGVAGIAAAVILGAIVMAIVAVVGVALFIMFLPTLVLFAWVPLLALLGPVGYLIVMIVAIILSGVVAGAIVFGVSFVTAVAVFLAGMCASAILPLLFLCATSPVSLCGCVAAPCLGCGVQTVGIPLLYSVLVFGFSVVMDICLGLTIGCEELVSFISMLINFIVLFLIQMAIQLLEMLGVSQVSSTIAVFVNRCMEIMPTGTLLASLVQLALGVATFGCAVILIACYIACYPCNFIWSNCYHYCCAPFMRPLGWS